MDCVKCKASIPDGALFCPWCGKKQAVTKKKVKKRANGMGSIIKKPGSRSKPWEAQKGGVYIGCFATRHEAEQALLKLADHKVLDTINLTFQQVYERWVPEHSRTVTGKGMEGYRTAFNNCAMLHDQIFRRLRTADFQEAVNTLEQKGLSKSSCEKVVQLFGQLSKWAIREEICSTNYAQFVTILATQKKEKAVFTPEQIRAIKASNHIAAPIAIILLATGCRPNELFAATVSNCHENFFISGSKTEAGKNRIIPVSPLGLEAYQSLLQTARDIGSSKLIEAYQGNHSQANFAKREWKDLMASLGIADMTPYNCRHTFTTMAVQAGIKPELLQKILGHADYSTTVDVYTHLGTEELILASQSLPCL
jgi:integrase